MLIVNTKISFSKTFKLHSDTPTVGHTIFWLCLGQLNAPLYILCEEKTGKSFGYYLASL